MRIFEAARTIPSLLEYCRVATKIKGVRNNALKLLSNFDSDFLLFAFCNDLKSSIQNCRVIQNNASAVWSRLNMETYC